MCFKIVGHSWQPERGLEIRGFIYTMEHLILCRTRELLEPLMAGGSGYKGQLPQLGQFKIVHLYMDYLIQERLLVLKIAQIFYLLRQRITGAITNQYNITLIKNKATGNITGYNAYNYYGIYNDNGTITTIENYGTISTNASSPDIYNRNGTIGTLINSQGGSDALIYKGSAPTNYEIVISDSTNYGKLKGLGV